MINLYDRIRDIVKEYSIKHDKITHLSNRGINEIIFVLRCVETHDVETLAKWEFRKRKFEEAVEKEVQRLAKQRKRKLFPWRIKIERVN